MSNKLESALKLAKQGYRIFPLLPNTKLPAIKNFSQHATTDSKRICDWYKHNPDFNIGISTDDLLVVDVDAKDSAKNGLVTIERLNKAGKIFPPTAQQITPTKGLHFIYLTPHPVKNSVSKLGPGLDIRGRGGYIVGAGSIIGGLPYTMNAHSREMSPEWLQGACTYDADSKPLAQTRAAIVDPKIAWRRGSEFLSNLPITTAGARNDSGYKIAARLKDIGLSQVDCACLMLEEWKCEPMLESHEIEHVVKSAFTYGKDAQGSAAPEGQFEKVPDDNGVTPIAALNKNHAYLILQGSHCVLYETVDPNGVFKVEYLDMTTFHTKYLSRQHQPDGGKTEQLTKFWLRHAQRREYEGVTFSPEQPVSSKFYNLWRGFAKTELGPNEPVTDAMRRGVEAFESHILENVCKGDTGHFHWVMSWLAHMIQKPWEKPGTALVLRGKKGVGKTIIFEMMKEFFPRNYFLASNQRFLTGNFNGHLENLLLFVADEAFWSGDRSADGPLKGLITGHDIIIERKGFEPYPIDSKVRVAILGNEDWVVPASHEERRYAIFDMGEGRRQDRVFFGQMKEDMFKGGGLRYLFTKLKHYQIGKTDVGQIPITEGLLQQKLRTLSPEKMWWFESLSQGYFANISDFSAEEGQSMWPTILQKEEFKNAFYSHSDQVGRSKFKMADDLFFSIVKEMCPSFEIIYQPNQPVKVKLPSLEIAKKEFNAYLGQEIKWKT